MQCCKRTSDSEACEALCTRSSAGRWFFFASKLALPYCHVNAALRYTCACRCLPKAARRLNSKNIECEACGLVRAGREQAMAAMSCAADPAGAMLHGQCVPEAEQRNAPQMPPSAAHQVSPVVSTAPPPAVAPSGVSPSEQSPLVAGTSGSPAAEPQNHSAVQADEGVPPSSRSQAAIKAYSPASIVKQKIPAVTASIISPDVHMKAMQGAWNSQMPVAGKDKPEQQQQAATATEAEAEEEAPQSSQQEPELSSRDTSVR